MVFDKGIIDVWTTVTGAPFVSHIYQILTSRRLRWARHVARIHGETMVWRQKYITLQIEEKMRG